MVMEQLNEFLKNVNYGPILSVGIAAFGLAICLIVVIMLLHTLHLLGQKTPLYRKHQPIEGWSKQFYPAGSFMVIFLLMLMWLLNVWSHKLATAR